jgi:outer membrane protein OmpU
MKNILLATTALVATAGVAAADVSVSGDGRMGFVYNESAAEKTTMSSRIRITFSASGETDAGLSFGGSVRADNAASGSAGTAGSVFISGGFGKLSMGDVDGAAKAAVGNVSGVGYTGIGDHNELAYLNAGSDVDGDGTDDTIYPVPSALYEYSAADVTFYAGIGQIGGDATLPAGQSYSVGVKYTGVAGLTLSAGYEATDDLVTAGNTGTQWVLGADYTTGAFTVKGRYGAIDIGTNDATQYAVSADYAFGATTVTGFYRAIDLSTGIDGSSYGIGAAYDLGGGATFAGGIVQTDIAGVDNTRGDLGIKFSF